MPRQVSSNKALYAVIAAVVVLLSLFLTPQAAFAAGATIPGNTGESNGQSGNSLSNVTVTLMNGATVVQSTTSDTNGDFSFTNIADGSYTVVATAPVGYKTLDPIPVTVTGGTPSPASVGVTFTPYSIQGYWEVASDGGVFNYGQAAYLGSEAGKSHAPIVGMIGTPNDDGYYLVASDGGVFAFGNAPFYGSMGGKSLNAPIVGIAPAVEGNGDGYYLVGADGGVYAFGPDATFHGSMGGQHLNAPIVGMTVDATDGHGYYLAASDGGVFAFDAPFLGSAGSVHLAKPVVGITTNVGPVTTDQVANGGYYLVASDGGVFTYGGVFHGSEAGKHLAKPVIGIDEASDGAAYMLAASDGGVFDEPLGAGFYGSAASVHLAAPVVGIWTT